MATSSPSISTSAATGREQHHPPGSVVRLDAHPRGGVERRQRPAAEHRDAGTGRRSRQLQRRAVGHDLGDGRERDRERRAPDDAPEQASGELRRLLRLLAGGHVARPGRDQAPQGGLAGDAAPLPPAAPPRAGGAAALPGLLHPGDDIPAPGDFRARAGRWDGGDRGCSCENERR
jgi:hypothetical protein